MTLEQFYNIIGGSSIKILDRLGEESFIKKFIVKFLDDPTFKLLNEDVQNKNLDKANFDAHTLKGVCAMLGFIKLKELTEQFLLCLKQDESYEEIWQLLKNEYELIIQTIEMTNWKDYV